jgi:hypothetical protein
MGLFSRGRHSINKKYERFSDVHKYSVKYRKRSRNRASREKPSDANGESLSGGVLPTRREIHGRRRGLLGRFMSAFIGKYIATARSKYRERMRRIKESHGAALLGYIPMRLFIGLSVVSFGLYPYTWLWDNVYAFNKVCGNRVDEMSVKRLAVLGFCVQLLLPITLLAYAAWRVTYISEVFVFAVNSAIVMGTLYFLVIFPMRCFHYFNLRWTLRSAVIAWDREGVMIGRTMTSWLKLFLLGSTYIQFHINRLMGLGMPGFADASEIEMDLSISEKINNYIVVGRTDRDAAPWTKDDWEPEPDDDEYEYYDG